MFFFFFKGLFSPLAESLFSFFLAKFAASQVHVLLVEFPGYGLCSGKPSEAGRGRKIMGKP